MVMPVHVGYIRWSSDPQEDGDSERRQRSSILEDARRQGVTVTRWLQDEGVSASSGENLAKGELGRFLDEVRKGGIPRGSVLYLDEPTRLTRLNPSKAMRIVADLQDAGVSIRLSARAQTLTGDSLYELLGFLIESAAGHAFTQELGRKVHEAWSAKREGARQAPGKEVLTSNTPYGIAAVGGQYTVGRGWSGREYAPHTEESIIVKLIFELARDGFSPRQIAVRLNTEGVPSPHASRGRTSRKGALLWRGESIRDIIKDRTYLDGSYQPCRGSSKKGKVSEGDRIVGHYPVFLDEGLWQAANSETLKRASGRRTTHRSGSSNLFTGIIACSHCGGPISLRSGSEKGRIPALYCMNARVGSCESKEAVHRWRVEAAILGKLFFWLSPESILSDLNRAHEVVDRDAVLERLRAEVGEREKEVGRLTDRVLELTGSANMDLFEERLTRARRDLAELRARVAEFEREREQAESEIAENVRAARDFRGLVCLAVYGEPRAEICAPVVDLAKALKDCHRIEEQLVDQIEPARVKLKAALRRILDKVELNLVDGRFELHLKSGGLLKGNIGEEIDYSMIADG